VAILNNVIGNEEFEYCGKLKNVMMGNSVTSIGNEAFEDCYSLTSVTIPNSVTSIGLAAFYECTNLTSVTMGNSVASIGVQAFYNDNLTSIVIPNSVTSIGEQAFIYCASLTRVTMGNSVTSIGLGAFEYCHDLTNLTFLGNVPVLGSSALSGLASGATVYYYSNTSGWGTSFGGAFDAPVNVANGILPTVKLNPPQISGGSLGVSANGFSFTIAGSSNEVVVVEASTNLVNWLPIQTNTLSDRLKIQNG
jgi:hypothetical protein